MPKIKQQVKASFKKKPHRSWDSDLLSSLKIQDNSYQTQKDINNTQEIKQSHDQNIENIDMELSKNNNSNIKIATGKSSKRVHSEFIESSNVVQAKSKDSSNVVQAKFKESSKDSNTRFNQGSNTVQNKAINEPKSVNLSHQELIRRLPKNEHLIFKCVIQICQNQNDLETGFIHSIALDRAINSTRNSRETAIKRLVKKGLLIRKKGNPRQGTINLAITQEVKEEAIHFFIANPLNHIHKIDIDCTEFSLSSSSSNINTTTKLSEEWKNINFELLRDYGFNEKHIMQISKIDSITPDDLQRSINHFIFDLQENDKAKEIKKSPIAFFMGIMRGQEFYLAPKNYESPRDRKLRLIVEQEKREKERRNKLESELIDIEFNEWRLSLNDDELESLIPESIKNATVAKDRQIRGFLREYFIKTFWDAIKQDKHADCFS